ncbi:hypothetical protein KSP39_PZI019548 [Platanthera zijinensis]|uniref:Uncharacterized protein n=1 Tax=Platanthera zijinensis TaxID=2320716 RepID=A0AAP0B2C7_9ASPA
MGLPSVFSLSDKENCSSIALHLCCSGKRIIKKKRSQRRRSRRIPLRDITHLCNYYSLRLPSGEPKPPFSFFKRPPSWFQHEEDICR